MWVEERLAVADLQVEDVHGGKVDDNAFLEKDDDKGSDSKQRQV